MMTDREIDRAVALLRGAPPQAAHEALRALEAASAQGGGVYRHWDDFVAMLDDESSYVRTRGLVMIARNARWDGEGRTDALLERCLAHVTDPKPIAARRCIQELRFLLTAKPHLAKAVRARLEQADFSAYPDSMRSLVQRDALDVLAWMDETIQKNG